MNHNNSSDNNSSDQHKNDSRQINNGQIPPFNFQFLNNFPMINSYQPNNTQCNQNMLVSLFQIVQQQTYALQSLMGKVQQMALKTQQLNQKILALKSNQIQQIQSGNQNKKNLDLINSQQNVSQNIDSTTLIKILFGSGNIYQYHLQLTQKIQMPLYRQRNFSIKLQLKDQQGNIIHNQNKIPLSLAIYSSQNPPKFLETNTVGQKMVKGFTQQTLHYGVCHFQKIQIRQVTSHFRNGWVFIVIIPSMTPLGGIKSDNIDYKKIEPMVLSQIIVKAKKIKQNKDKKKQIKKQKESSQQDNNHSNLQKQQHQISQGQKCYQEGSS